MTEWFSKSNRVRPASVFVSPRIRIEATIHIRL